MRASEAEKKKARGLKGARSLCSSWRSAATNTHARAPQPPLAQNKPPHMSTPGPMFFKRRRSGAADKQGDGDGNAAGPAPTPAAAGGPPAKKKQQASLASFGFGGGGGGGAGPRPALPVSPGGGGSGGGGAALEVDEGARAEGTAPAPPGPPPPPPPAAAHRPPPSIDPATGLPLARNPASHARWQAKLARSGDLDRRRRGEGEQQQGGGATAGGGGGGGGAGPGPASTAPKLTPLEAQVTALQADNPGTLLAIEGECETGGGRERS